jgi:hypothetical protein
MNMRVPYFPITYLNDHPDETGNRVKKGYMTQVVEQLPGIEYVNKGYNGWTTAGIARKIDELGLEKAVLSGVFQISVIEHTKRTKTLIKMLYFCSVLSNT